MAILSSDHRSCGQSPSSPSRVCGLHRYKRACTVCLALCVFFGIHLPSCHGHDRHDDYTAPQPDDQGGGMQPVGDPASPERWDATQHVYVRSIFERYGDGETITFEAFEHLLENLGLGHLVISDHVLTDHFTDGGFNAIHKEHNHVNEHVDHDHSGHLHDPHGEDLGHANHTSHSTLASSDHSLPLSSTHGSSDAEAEGPMQPGSNPSGSRRRRGTENALEDKVVVSTETSDALYEAGGLRDDEPEFQQRKLNSVHPTPPTSPTSLVQLPGYQDDGVSSSDSSVLIQHRSGHSGSHDYSHNSHKELAHHNAESYDTLRRSRQSRHLHKQHPLRHHSNRHGDVTTYRRTIKRPNIPADGSGVQSEMSRSNSMSVSDHQSYRVRRETVDRNDKCLSVNEILAPLQLDSSAPLRHSDFLQLCPLLIAQLDVHACDNPHQDPSNSSHNHSESHQGDHGDHDHDHDHDDYVAYLETNTAGVPLQVWGYASLSVIIISLVGLVGVAMVPVMQKVFYNHLLQFLVALAVGSLTGDALLHLLPHALIPHGSSGHDHGSDTHHTDHKAGVWRGLTALSGVYFFFLMERIMGSITNWKRNKNKKKKRCTSSKLYPAEEAEDGKIGDKLSKHQDRVASCELTTMMVHPDKDLRMMAEDAHVERHADCIPEDQTNIVHQHANDHNDVEFKTGGHVHSHHGHSHEVPTTVAAVAWMVIMGDGLHNFSDGLAIGAAFADSLTGGLSTSVAVFCHELPHELGDFAVLLRAGMSVKQAMVYNMVSSILCFLGMVVGIGVGNFSSASLWIFALAGGMFIYIALVDMIPEMTSMNPKQGEHPLFHHALQHLGLLTGATIMLLIAIYEEDIIIPFPASETP